MGNKNPGRTVIGWTFENRGRVVRVSVSSLGGPRATTQPRGVDTNIVGIITILETLQTGRMYLDIRRDQCCPTPPA